MTQLQAVGLTVAFLIAIILTICVCVLVAALRYEIKDRLKRRARGGYIAPTPQGRSNPPATIHPIAMARSRREQQAGRGTAA